MPDRNTSRDGASKTNQGVVLGDVAEVRTVGDVVSLSTIDSQVSDGWSVAANPVQFGDEALEEAVVFSRSRSDPELALKPAAMTEPKTDIEWYERKAATDVRRQVRTLDSLQYALRAAVNWTHQRDA